MAQLVAIITTAFAPCDLGKIFPTCDGGYRPLDRTAWKSFNYSIITRPVSTSFFVVTPSGQPRPGGRKTLTVLRQHACTGKTPRSTNIYYTA